MSARMLQRALRNHQAEVAVDSSNVDRSDDSDGDGNQGSISNPFELLGFQDQDESECEDAERDSRQQNAASSASTSATGPVVRCKSKRKKNKSRKKGKKEPSFNERPMVTGDDDLVDKLFESLVVRNSGGSSSLSCGSLSKDGKSHREKSGEFSSILCVDVKHLRAQEELRRIFGSKVINSVERRGEGVPSRRRQGVANGRTGRGVPLRRSLLVAPMEHWPQWDGGITMELFKVKGRIQFFRYQHSVFYEGLQKRYESCVASHDPNMLLILLNSHPYHVDSLLALAEVYKQMGEHQQSADLVEKCLYALECAWHPCFNSALGSCRLEFSWDANKSLFLALFRHMQHLGRRGCHRTALEVCKLLLSLDPSDPLGALFYTDYFSLRAEQYEWLEHFVDEYQADKSTSLLPNFSFSVAVARFHLEHQQLDKSTLANGNRKGDKGSIKSNIPSEIILQQALLLHPPALKKIIAKAPIKVDESWTKILSHSQFSHAPEGGPTVEHLIDIYVERNYLVWRSSELQGWLKEAATVVTEIADGGLALKSDLEITNSDSIWNNVFPWDKNLYSHLHVSEYSDSTSTLLPEDMPLLNIHPHRGGFPQEDMPREPPHGESRLQRTVYQADFPARNALLLLLQSLVPRMDYGVEASVEDTPTLLEDDGDDND